VKPYACSECPKCFCTTTELRYHQLVHSDYKQFCCGLCCKYFKRTGEVKRHFRKCFANMWLSDVYSTCSVYLIYSLSICCNLALSTMESVSNVLSLLIVCLLWNLLIKFWTNFRETWWVFLFYFFHQIHEIHYIIDGISKHRLLSCNALSLTL